MTEEELEKEAEDKGVKYADSLEYTISKFSDEEGYCWSQVEQAYEKGALDFAEPREKRIAELGAKNVELKDENKRLKKIEEDYYDFLQKKNEEDWKGDNVVGCLNLRIEQKDKQLTKAKEIIREYMRFEPMIGTCSFYSEEYEKTKKQAEQFLNEVEK